MALSDDAFYSTTHYMRCEIHDTQIYAVVSNGNGTVDTHSYLCTTSLEFLIIIFRLNTRFYIIDILLYKFLVLDSDIEFPVCDILVREMNKKWKYGSKKQISD